MRSDGEGLMKILKVIPYENAVAIEYEAQPGYPETFTMTWESLEVQLELRERTPDEMRRECVVLALMLLKQKVEAEAKEQENNTDLLDIANETLK